jgi:hypothetical protein
MKNKSYITVLFLFIGGIAIVKYIKSKKKKLKGSIIVDSDIIENAYAVEGSTVYKNDLETPIYTFKILTPLKILDKDDINYVFKVQFTSNSKVIIGFIDQREIIFK